jgi:hypothetical protein
MTTIVELEARVATLESQVAEWMAGGSAPRKAVQALPARPLEPEGARILHSIERAPIALPTAAELEKLAEIVFAAYPRLRPWEAGSRYEYGDLSDFFAKFGYAFSFVAGKGRGALAENRQSLSWWADHASEWLRSRGNTVQIGAGTLLVAAVAAGDVDFVPGDAFGNIWSFALAKHGGTPATEAWRRVLSDRLLRRPLPGVHKPPAASGNFSVRRADG